MKLKVQRADRDDIFGDIVRVHWSQRGGISSGKICRVSSNGRTIFGIARNTLRDQRDVIVVDDALRKRLGLKEGDVAEVTIRDASAYGNFKWAVNSSNAVVRVAAQLAALSIVLGFIGLTLGAISLAVTFR